MTGRKGIVLEEPAVIVIDKSDFKRKVAEIREKKLKEEAGFIQNSSAPGKNKRGSKP